MPDVRSVSLGLYVGIGARYESEQEAGVSHFLEHMVFKGCEGWPSALDIAREVEGRGGYLNASTGYEATSYWVRIGARFWKKGLHLLSNMVRFPLLDAEEFEIERGVILDEIAMYRDVPEDRVAQLSGQALWDGHPLGRDIAGEPESVSALTVDALRSFHARAYRPESAVLAAAGAVKPDELVEAAATYLGDWRAEGQRPTFDPAPQTLTLPRYRLQIQNTEQAHLQLAAPGLSRFHPDRFALSLLHAILGDGMISLLWQRLREQLGLAYNIGSYVNMFADSGSIGVYGGCDARRLFKMLDEINLVWRHLQEQPLDENLLQQYREYVKGRLELSSEDSAAVAAWWGGQLIYGRIPPLTLDQALAEIDAVQPEDIQRLAQQLWRPERLALAYVGPLESEQRLAEWLSGPVPA